MLPCGSSGECDSLVHFVHSTHFVSCFFSLLLFMPAQRLSQQSTQQASFLPSQSQYNPADVEVPQDAFDATIDAQSWLISNTVSLYSSSSDSFMCGAGFTGTCSPAGTNFARDGHTVRPADRTVVRTSEQHKDNFVSSLTLPPAPRSGCVLNRHVQSILMKPLRCYSVAICLKWLFCSR